jgi:hypothetical protein
VLPQVDGKKEKTMYKYILLAGMVIFMTGCQDRYRYPCQDPKNINLPECSVEVCNTTHECPTEKGENDGK